jgi:3',5'-cyclic-AMP phosphodiesterase
LTSLSLGVPAPPSCGPGVARKTPQRFDALVDGDLPFFATTTRMQKTLAHLSDLHVGRGGDSDHVLQGMCQALIRRNVEHVVVTGDITHRGRWTEWERFRRAFAPLQDLGRLTVIPGNHDRLNEDVGATMMPDGRVVVESHPGLHLVLFDSTGPHNRSLLSSHGLLSEQDVGNILQAFTRAPRESLAVLLLHHHLVPLPHDNPAERLISWLGWGSGEELALGRRLLSALRGRCDLVLHGHRHDPVTLQVHAGHQRPLSLFNAGSSTELQHVRLFAHHRGRLAAPPVWMPLPRAKPAPFFELVASSHLGELVAEPAVTAELDSSAVAPG